jgi:hypothetical protein
MHTIVLSQQVRWFGGKQLIYILKVQGSILISDMSCDQHKCWLKFFIYIADLG